MELNIFWGLIGFIVGSVLGGMVMEKWRKVAYMWRDLYHKEKALNASRRR